MKKTWAVGLAGAVLVAAQIGVQQASAQTLPQADTWRGPYPLTFTYPKNWLCGVTVNTAVVSQQTCIARDGIYAQVVTVVRNRSAAPLQPVSAVQRVHYADGTVDHNCAVSGIPARSVSVCYTHPIYAPQPIPATVTVTTPSGPINSSVGAH